MMPRTDVPMLLKVTAPLKITQLVLNSPKMTMFTQIHTQQQVYTSIYTQIDFCGSSSSDDEKCHDGCMVNRNGCGKVFINLNPLKNLNPVGMNHFFLIFIKFIVRFFKFFVLGREPVPIGGTVSRNFGYGSSNGNRFPKKPQRFQFSETIPPVQDSVQKIGIVSP